MIPFVTMRYDIERLETDMALKGWVGADLSRASGVSAMTVSRFLSGHTQTPRVAMKLAAALGYSVRRYLMSSRKAA